MDGDGLPRMLEAVRASRSSGVTAPELKNRHPADIASVLAELDVGDAHDLLTALPPERRAEVFGYLNPELQGALAARSSRAELAELLIHIAPDERADVFNRLPPPVREALLPALARAEREDLRRLAAYPEGTVGAVMTSDYVVLHPELTAREAVEYLRAQAPDSETIYQAYVVDEARRLIGTLSLRELIVAPPGATVRELMIEHVISVRADEPCEVAASKIARYDFVALPVW